MPPIQHKREAYWFYFVVSRVYDRWVNPLFWTARMRTEALELARLGPGMDVVDVGAGTGFATEGIVALAPPEPPDAPMTPRRWLRFAAGSVAGLAFVPVALALSLRARLRRR